MKPKSSTGYDRRLLLATLALLSAGIALGAVVGTGVANVRDFGAKGDGKTDDTAAIRQAIEAVPLHGGVVYFPAGHYVSATITGRSNVTFDARKGRSASPLNGILLEGLEDSVVANNSLFHAAQKMLIIDQGGHQNATIRDNPGSPALPSQREAGSAKP